MEMEHHQNWLTKKFKECRKLCGWSVEKKPNWVCKKGRNALLQPANSLAINRKISYKSLLCYLPIDLRPFPPTNIIAVAFNVHNWLISPSSQAVKCD
jgi:hypothetical protein